MIPTVAQKIGIPAHKRKAGCLGVEVEVEGENLPHLATDNWRSEHDHSLRGECKEYVMREPRSLEDTLTSLNELKVALEGSTYYESPRAGVHVHVNVQDFNVVQLFNAITATYLLETILTRYCGEFREGNLFCLRACDAEYQVTCVEDAAKSMDLGILNTDMIRYSALNLNSLSKYGSIEYRAMRSTSDFSVLNTWCKVLHNLKEQALTFNNPLDIVSMALEAPESFVYKMLGECAGELLEGVNIEEELAVGLEFVLPYANEVDWSSFEETIIGGVSFPNGTQFPNEPLEDW